MILAVVVVVMSELLLLVYSVQKCRMYISLATSYYGPLVEVGPIG